MRELEALTFQDERFDIVITQVVFEHVVDYRRAFREVMRTLRGEGAHIFTTPKYRGLAKTEERVSRRDGEIVYLFEPEYHMIREDKTGTIAEFMEVFVTRKTSIADSA